MSEEHHVDAGDEDERSNERIHVGHRPDGTPVSLPVERVLTGRSFLTGKSGSGKSNSASVVIEELLDRGFPVAIVDTDGEYYGLKEEYELLHAGADEECDVRVDVEHAEKLATLALEENVPVILDVSGYLDGSRASELIRETARHLFAKEKKLKKPFLLVVEEIHEYVPEGGGMDDTGRMLVKVGKRGRKHGLGIVGISQRPADVKKDFITQANWLVWHRLTWNNDTKVVERIVGDEYGDAVSGLDDGEAFLQADWTDDPVQRVQFRRKRTFDAGATPGLEDFERPELKSVSDGLMDDLSTITEEAEREADRIAELESELERRDERIAELERELERARDVSSAAERMATAVADDLGPEAYQARLGAKNDEIDRLHDRVAALESRIDEVAAGDPPPSLDEFGGDGTTGDEPEPEPKPEPGVPSVETGGAVPQADPDEVAAAVARAAGGPPDADDGSGPDGHGDGSGPDHSGRGRPPGDGDSSRDGSGASIDDRADGARGSGAGAGPDGEAGSGSGDREDLGARYFTAEDGDVPDPAGSDPFAEYESIESYQAAVADRDGRTPHVDRAGGRFRRSDAGRSGGVNGDDRGHGDRRSRDGGGASDGEDRPDGGDGRDDELADLLGADPVAARLRAAIRGARCNESLATEVLATLAAEGPITFEAAAEEAGVPAENAYSLLSALRARDLVTRDADHRYALDREGMARTVEAAGDGPYRELQEQWDVE
jgi:hypothetical protein